MDMQQVWKRPMQTPLEAIYHLACKNHTHTGYTIVNNTRFLVMVN